MERKFPAFTLKGKPLMIAGGVLLILVNYLLFMPEIISTFQHLLHGSHVEIQGIRFQVPWLYEADSGFQRNFFSLEDYQGIARQFFHPARLLGTSIAVEMRPAMIGHVHPNSQREAAFLKVMGMKPVSEYEAVVAGRSGLCKKAIEIDAITATGNQEMEISCSFGDDLRIDFRGPARNAVDLDDFLRDAKAVPQNR